MKTGSWKWWLLVPGLLSLLVAASAWILATQQGTRWILRQVETQLDSPELSVRYSGIEGTLLHRLELRGLTVSSGEIRFDAQRLTLQWRPAELFNRRLHLVELGVQQAQLKLPAARNDTEPSAWPPELPEIRLPVRVLLEQANVQQLSILQGEQVQLIETLQLGARADSDRLSISAIKFEGLSISASADLSIETRSPHAIEGRIGLRAAGEPLGRDIAAIVTDLELSGQALQPRLKARTVSPLRADAEISANLHPPLPEFDVRVRWQDFDWPLQDDQRLAVSAGELSLSGNADDYRLFAATLLKPGDLPQAEIQLQAQGDLEKMHVQALRMQTLGGRIDVKGTLGWVDFIAWQLQLQASGIDPGVYDSALAGTLDARVASKGSLDETLRMNAVIEQLDGKIQGYPVGGAGELIIDGQQVNARALRLDSAENHLRLDGRLVEPFDLSFRIDAPQLQTVLPGLSGSVAGHGRIKGSLQAPTMVSTLAASDIAYGGSVVRQLDLSADWQSTGGTVKLQLSGIRQGEREIESLQAMLNGTPQSHTLKLDLASDEIQGQLATTGTLADKRWSGTLHQLQLVNAQFGSWSLAQPSALSVGKEHLRIESVCLQNNPARICANGQLKGTRLAFDASVKDFDLKLLAPLMPENIRLAGPLAGEAEVKGSTTGPDISLHLSGTSGTAFSGEGSEAIELDWRDAVLDGQFRNDRGSLRLDLLLGSNGTLSADIALGAAGKQDTRPLKGVINAGFPDLGLIAGFVPTLDELKGKLRLQGTIGGTSEQPRIDGKLAIVDASCVVPDAGIALENINLELRGDGSGPLQLMGSAHSGEGEIEIRGNIDPFVGGGEAKVQVALRGDRFELVDLPEANVFVSPDLHLRGQGSYHLSGRLEIPQAAIEIKKLPEGTVQVSPDEIIIGEDGRIEKERKQASPVTADVELKLGDNVKLKAFGLDTRLSGALQAIVKSDSTAVQGHIDLKEGRYQAYGQDLDIEQGRLLFNGPGDNPNLSLRAARESDDGTVTAYLAMNGPVKSPSPRVYTDPVLPENEALAYLLTGKSAKQGGGKFNLGATALSLGLAKTSPVLQQVGDTVGLDDLEVAGGENGLEDTTLVLGKYLSPDLYVGYTTGLMNPEGAVLMRYRLSDRVNVENRSGTTQSVDIFYLHEHD